MKFTGERVIPGQDDADLLNEHRARYWFARRYASGKTVLDAACGTGYGSALLAETAPSVVGVDIARDAVEYARAHFTAPNLRFAQADCLALPFAAGRFDLVVAFEIIEHLDNPEAFLAELRRVLDPSGLLILSTPNRLYYTDDRGEINPFHRREFCYAEFDEILRPLFPHCAILFQNHVAALAVSGPGAELSATAVSADCFVPERSAASAAPSMEAARRGAHFFVALCSARPLGPVAPLLYLPFAGNLLRERELYIHLLRTECRELQHHLSRLQADYDSKIAWALSLEQDVAKARGDLRSLQADYEQDLEKARGDLRSLQADYESKIAWAVRLERELEKARGDLARLQEEFEERTAWALRLNNDLEVLVNSRWYRWGKKLNQLPVLPSERDPSDSGSR